MDKAAANTTMETTGFNHPMGFPLKLGELYCLVSAGSTKCRIRLFAENVRLATNKKEQGVARGG